jgi:hypothetical protein
MGYVVNHTISVTCTNANMLCEAPGGRGAPRGRSPKQETQRAHARHK